jgi:3-deoxy-7-phosphoheptulonate synthase
VLNLLQNKSMNRLPFDPHIQANGRPYFLIAKNSTEGPLLQHDIVVGGINMSREPLFIPGPCAIENEGVANDSAEFLASKGVRVMRGGLWKPRSSPYSFQGFGEVAAHWAIRACLKHGIKAFVTEVVSEQALTSLINIHRHLDPKGELEIILQVGTRNAQNFELLKAVGKTSYTVLLKRGMANDLEEFLGAAEYIASEGNTDIILCLRGHRLTESDGNRFALDYSDVAALKSKTWLPVIFDPSHSTGSKDKVLPVSLQALQSGADGLLVDVHPDPSIALCDAKQALTFDDFPDFQKITEI